VEREAGSADPADLLAGMKEDDMKIRATIVKWLEVARREATLRDEIGKYLNGPWLDELTDELEHEAKRWWWIGMGVGLLAGVVSGGLLGFAFTKLL